MLADFYIVLPVISISYLFFIALKITLVFIFFKNKSCFQLINATLPALTTISTIRYIFFKFLYCRFRYNNNLILGTFKLT